MLPVDKKNAVAIFARHKEWTVACLTELPEKVKVQMKDMQNLLMCLDAAEVDPSQLEGVAAAPAAATILTGEGAGAAAAMQDAIRGLVNSQLVTKVGASCQ